jgi:hypothetical protein
LNSNQVHPILSKVKMRAIRCRSLFTLEEGPCPARSGLNKFIAIEMFDLASILEAESQVLNFTSKKLGIKPINL